MTERGAILLNERLNSPVAVRDLADVMQFELDGPFQNFEPHTHYAVEPNFIEDRAFTKERVNSIFYHQQQFEI